MTASVEAVLLRITGLKPKRLSRLGGGCVSDVLRADLEDGRSLVVKQGDAESGLATEAFMLDYLRRHSRLPVPQVLHSDDRMLVMHHIAGGGALDDAAQIHAADLIAELHGIAGLAFGFERATLIGGLDQPNPSTPRWLDFFRESRLLFMAKEAAAAGRLPQPLLARIERLATRLDRWIAEPAHPSLIHGDLWGGNVLARDGRITGFIDPAIYFADPEIELAFSTLFGTFGEPFFARYREHRPLRPGFFEERRDLYNLYPLLVHVRLFGGAYVGRVESTLARFGFT